MIPKLEYIVLIILALIFYFTTIREDQKRKENKKFIKKNIKIGSRVITESKIIGEVIEYDNTECLIVTGKDDKISYILIDFNSIESLIEA
ncbi:preprotein translocase subunit YajC [Anaerococcus sp. AGMB00486]|uniref:Preprotein translocase subunit YajC n=2 Tax=Anaerococcus TaxID=165779 RepID=A0ABX2N7H3_9FIRM|nr:MULTISPECIES: preprotein translocase subunit YajC [Anaerococcus]MDY3005447.1 preprotein translocase subunit YajC [Anaerococcus porci]MSS76875.1 preprotein translocase subunit YajC [Anaerococcus porci]NVF10641.1 preprotein translocase subunit YajC [Anaerococcus faecalis]